MEFRHFQAFVAVAEELHFGRAAERLHLAQPYLSRLIRQLENELKVTLLERSTRSVHLTPIGQTFLPAARNVIVSVDEAIAIAEHAGDGDVGIVSVGIGGIAMTSMLPTAAASLRERKPRITLSIQTPVYSRQALELVAEGRLDLAFIRIPDQHKDVAMRVVQRERLVLAAPPDHELARATTVDLADLAHEKFIGYPSAENTTTLSAIIQNACLSAGFSPNYVQYASETHAILAMVSAGLGVALTSSSVVGRVAQEVVFVPLTDVGDATGAAIAWNPQRMSPATRTVLEVLEEVMPTPETSSIDTDN